MAAMAIASDDDEEHAHAEAVEVENAADSRDASPGASDGGEDSSEKEEGVGPSSSGAASPVDPSRGCKHYRRGCALVAPCCGEVFACRFCHDEVKNGLAEPVEKRHTLDRKAVTRVVCLACREEQPVAARCRRPECGNSFGAYFCEHCRLYDDDDTKGQFHCDKCGMCRVGGRENFWHCDRCGCCFHVDIRNEHKCIERALHQDCPICFEYLFDSTKQIAVLPCGHTLHKACFEQMQRQFLRSGDHNLFLKANVCPLCSKSVRDMSFLWEHIDRELALTPMPLEYRDQTCRIICNDCERQTETHFHILALKCHECGGYNTTRM